MTNYDVMREIESDPERRTVWSISGPVFEAWAIRHKPTGAFMPMFWLRGCHLYSYDLPIAGAFPRLFPSRISAQNALNAWLAGTWKTEWEEEYEDGYRVGGYRTEPQVSRKGSDLGRRREDMEVVRVVLRIESED